MSAGPANLRLLAPHNRIRLPSTRNVAKRRTAGFTLIELLIVISIVALTSGLVLAAVARARSVAQATTCVDNLRRIAESLHMYANENGDKFPDPQGAQTSWESVLQSGQGDLRQSLFLCPSDGEIGPVTGSSYDWRDTALPLTTLAGKSLFDINRGDAILVLEALPGWHLKKKINVARIDGSCTAIDGEEAVADLLKPIR